MKRIILGATMTLLTFVATNSMAQYNRTEQIRVERRMADMESISVRKFLDGLLRGDYVEQLFVDATDLYANSRSYLDIIIDDRVVKTVALSNQLSRYSFPVNMRNGEDYTRVLLRARGNVYVASFGVVINDGSGWQPQPQPPRPRPPERPPFTQGEFCNGSTIVHWECGYGARGNVAQPGGCYHTDTGRYCGSRPEPVRPPRRPHPEPIRPEPVRPPERPSFTQGEFCNGSTIVHWECGYGARGNVAQPGGCYHTDTGRGCH